MHSGGELSQREDDRNATSFRIPPTPQSGSSTKPAAALSEHQLKTKLKLIISQVVEMIETFPGDADAVADAMISIVDEGIKDLKSAKVNARLNRRKAAARGAEAASPKAEPTTEPPSKPTREPAKTWASLLQPKNAVATHDSPPPQVLPLAREPTTHEKTDVNASVESAISDVPSVTRARDDLSQRPPTDKQAAGARSQERLLEAEERRKAKTLEVVQRQERTNDRIAMAKARREQAVEKIRHESQERTDRAAKRAEEEIEKRREFAVRDGQRVDEVVFTAAASQELMAIDIDEKQRQAQALRDELQQQKTEVQRGRVKEYEAVLDRARDLSQNRREQHASKLNQKLEQGKRHDEARRQELEQKQMAAEERHARAQELHAKIQEEERAKQRKVEQRIELSANLRSEQREAQKQKLEQREKKVREARERRERGEDTKTFSFQDVLANWVTEIDEEKQSTAVSLVLSAGQRSAKSFCESYVSANPSPPPARARIRAMLGRLSSSSCTSQSRQPLHDMLSSLESTAESENAWSAGDHMHLRLVNGWATLLKSAVESRHAKPTSDIPTFKLVIELMHRLLLHPVEGPAHVEYFARAGHGLSIVAAFREETKILRKHNTSLPLKAFASLLQIVSSFVNASEKPSLQSARDLLNDALLASDVITFASSVASTVMSDVDVASLHYTLITVETLVRNPRRGFWSYSQDAAVRDEHLSRLTESLLTLVISVLSPPTAAGETGHNKQVSSATVFIALRILNCIARANLVALQSCLSAVAALSQLNHMIGAVCSFLTSYIDQMEKIPNPFPSAELLSIMKGEAAAAMTRSFCDAVDFGLTHQELPRPPWSANMEVPPLKQSFVRASLHELLLFCGYIALQNRPVQDMFAFLGHGSTSPLLLRLIATLPVSYFGLCKHIVFPTLLSICHRHEQNNQIVATEMDFGSVGRFLREEADARPRIMKRLKAAAQTSPQIQATTTLSVNWADVMEDDDDDAFACLGQAATTAEAVSNDSMALSTTHSVDTALSGMHQDKRVRHLQIIFFRVDRRFPIYLWPQVLEGQQ